MKKKLLEKDIRRLNYFEGSLNDIFSDLRKLEKEAKEAGYSNIEIRVEPGCYDSWPEFYLTGEREETDKEYEARLKREKKARKTAKVKREKKEARERAMLAKLKKKYE